MRFDGTVSSVGEGSYGRLGHGGSESETKMRTISALQGIPYIIGINMPHVSGLIFKLQYALFKLTNFNDYSGLSDAIQYEALLCKTLDADGNCDEHSRACFCSLSIH